jgi:cytoskeletal protein CcmA (bactofilin family)
VICEGAKVEGKIIAPDLVVQGEFKGTISGNNVKLQGSAVVDGEIFNKSLTIEQNALFEGVARRLDKPVAPPSAGQAPVETSAPALAPHSAPELKVVS